MDCFDADVLIYAAAPDHPHGSRLRRLVLGTGGAGSVLLLPEVLAEPLRSGGLGADEVGTLLGLLGRLDLRPVDIETAQLATTLAAAHRLRAADAVHLATAVLAGADRFVTDNRRDFPLTLTDVSVTYPEMLDAPG